MKALIRQENEVILETTALRFINWSTGAPLTNEAWAGGPYTLVTDYVPPKEKSAEQDAEPLPETVTYGGKEYTLEELKKLIG